MQRLCPVDVAPLLALLPLLQWQRSGTNPWDGTYGMIGWSHTPERVREAIVAIAEDVLPPGRRRGTTFLAKMVPGQRHPLHVDAEDGGCDYRIHVPLLTNPKAVFISEGIEHHMPVGWAYRVDPTKEHTAANYGESDRVHLLFNAVA